MPRRETLHDIEREIAQHLAGMREIMDPANFERMESMFHKGVGRILVGIKRKRRRRGDDGSMPALVEPPRGPKPFAGGAAVELEFD